MKFKCAFLDRDGVINQDKGYISKISDFKIYPGVGKAISLLNKKNYLVIIVTNQSGIGRGLIKIKELKNLHNHLKKKIKKYGGKIDDIFYCPFHPEFGKGKYKKKSNDRKPGDGMIRKAIKKWKINNWKTSSKKPVKNCDLWKRLDALCQQHEVDWKWVKGHAGNIGNERVDELARRAMEPYKKNNLS